MKTCNQCFQIVYDGDSPYVFCPSCGHHTFTEVGDELPWEDAEDEEELKSKVVEIMKRARQTLNWVNSKRTPIKRLLPNHRQRLKIIEQLMKDGVVDHHGGFMSLAYNPPEYIVESFTLTDAFFEQHCLKNVVGIQRVLF